MKFPLRSIRVRSASIKRKRRWHAMWKETSSSEEKESANHSTMYDAVVMLRIISYVTGFGNDKPPSAFVTHGIRICRKTTQIK